MGKYERIKIRKGFRSGNLQERDHLQDLVKDYRISITLVLKEIGWEGAGWINPAQNWISGGYFKFANDPSDPIKCG